MGKDLHTIDQLFQSAIEPYKDSPSEKVWSAIENKLDKRNGQKYRSKSFIPRAVAICLALILLSIGIYEVRKVKKINVFLA